MKRTIYLVLVLLAISPVAFAIDGGGLGALIGDKTNGKNGSPAPAPAPAIGGNTIGGNNTNKAQFQTPASPAIGAAVAPAQAPAATPPQQDGEEEGHHHHHDHHDNGRHNGEHKHKHEHNNED